MEFGSDALTYDFVLIDEQNAKSESAKEYFEDLNEPLTPGSCVRINGHIQKDCKRFVFLSFFSIM